METKTTTEDSIFHKLMKGLVGGSEVGMGRGRGVTGHPHFFLFIVISDHQDSRVSQLVTMCLEKSG